MRIFLTGFMGSGKSYWAKKWGSEFGYDFFDLDDIITTIEMQSIPDIFEKKGEEYFREKEAVVLRTMLNHNRCIIACGGGTPFFYNNMEWMNEHGTTVFLSASPKILLENIRNQQVARPLMKHVNENELLFFVEKKLSERLPVYSLAKITLHVSELTTDSFKTILDYA